MALLGAFVAAALGYAEGGRLARELGGWQVICWALVLSAIPLTVPVAIAIALFLIVYLTQAEPNEVQTVATLPPIRLATPSQK